MELLHVKVAGFRNLLNTKISFSKMTGLIALNGYGKSNVMDAVSFGFDFINNPNSIKRQMMAWKKGIPLLKKNLLEDFTFEVELRTEFCACPYTLQYGYCFSWTKNDKDKPKIKREFLKVKPDGKGQKYTSFLTRELGKAAYKSSESGRCSTAVRIDDDALVVNKLAAYDDLFFLELIQCVNNIQVYIERHLDASTSYQPNPLVFQGMSELEIDGIQNIPRAIFFLREEYPDKYELLKSAFIQLFPNLTDIIIQNFTITGEVSGDIDEDAPFAISDKIYAMSVVDRNLTQSINFEWLSDGAKRVFLMLTYAVVADIKGLSLIAIEEPENSIHPKLLQSYLNIISQLVNHCKIVFSSHSPYIIQYINPQDIYIGVPNDCGAAMFRKIANAKANSLIRDASRYDNATGDYLFGLLADYEDCSGVLHSYLENESDG